jgi:hypothetical protein
MTAPDVTLISPYPAGGERHGGFSGVAGYTARLADALADRGEHPLLQHRRHRVLQALCLLVHLVPRDPEDVRQEAFDQPVAAHDRLGMFAA